jgi:hypothetical protein
MGNMFGFAYVVEPLFFFTRLFVLSRLAAFADTVRGRFIK